MADNLLRNPGFELDWGTEKRNTAYVFPVTGDPYEVKFGSLFIPPGHDGYYRLGRPADFHDPKNLTGWVQPEITHMAKAQFPERVTEGNQSVKVFKAYGCFDGGLMQQVSVEPHRIYRLCALAHAWSHNKTPMDPYWSEGPGRGAGYLLEGDPPPANTPGTADDWRAFTFYLGIDPTGGSNPYVASVVWGRGAHIYNVFAPVPPVEAVAQGEYITIFLRSKNLWRFINNDAYWDAVQLQLVDQPQPGKCRGHPRIQYARTFNVYPASATRARKLEIAGLAVDRGNQTVGGSYDDAGVGDLNDGNRTAVLWDIAAEKRQDFVNFYRDYYSGVVVKFDGLDPTPPVTELKLAYPSTFLPPTITGRFNEPRPGYIHKGLDLRSSWAVWKNEVLAAFPGRVVVAGSLESEPGYGVQVQTETKLEDGRTVRVRYAHLVVGSARVIVGQGVVKGQLIGLPDNTGKSSGDHLHIDVRVNGVYVDPEPLIQWPGAGPGEPAYPKPAEFLSLHIQNRSPGDDGYIRAVKPEWVKLVFNMQWAREWIIPASPLTKVLYRYIPPNNAYDRFLKHPNGLRAGARLYLEQSLPSLIQEADWISAVEGSNELIGSYNLDDIKRKVEFECHFADWVYVELGNAVAPCLLNPGVGNPNHGVETQALRPAAEQAVKYNGYLGGHVYIGFRYADRYCTLDDASRHFSMRPLLSWDPEFRAVGLYPQYLFTEGGGIYIDPVAGMPSAHAGWKYKETCRGDWAWYLAKKMQYRAMVAAWNKEHGNRARGLMEFTFPPSGEWEHFGASKAQLEQQAAAIAAAPK